MEETEVKAKEEEEEEGVCRDKMEKLPHRQWEEMAEAGAVWEGLETVTEEEEGEEEH